MRVLWGVGLFLLATPAYPHDGYSGLRDPAGNLCCGDADCEPIDDYQVHPDGSVTFNSRRYRASISVPEQRVVWVSLPGAPAHWCGEERPDWMEEERHNSFVTFCAFVAPDAS